MVTAIFAVRCYKSNSLYFRLIIDCNAQIKRKIKKIKKVLAIMS